MAKLNDPDSLNQSTEVVFDAPAKTIQLLVAGNLSDSSPAKTSGVTGQCIYSFSKEEWRTDAGLNKYLFPIQMIFEAKFILINGWTWKDQQTKDLVRDAGFRENASGDEFACIISLGDQSADTDPSYYSKVAGFTASTTAFSHTGELNENYDITGATGYHKAFNRVHGKAYSSYDLLTEQGISSLSYQAYSFPLANADDPKITSSTATIDGMTGIKINYLKGGGFTTFANSTVYVAESVVYDASAARWYFSALGGTSNNTTVALDTGVSDWAAYEGERQIGANWYAYNRIAESDGSYSTLQVNEWLHRQLQSAADINAADAATVNQRFTAVNGELATDLSFFVGDQLTTEGGVFIDGYDPSEKNSYTFADITVDGGGVDAEGSPATTTERNFPFVATGNLNFGANIVAAEIANAGTTKYTAYFDYITTTTDSTIGFTVTSSPSGNFTWTGTVLDHLSTSDYFIVSGFTDAALNGEWLIDSTGSNTLLATRQGAGITVSTEAAGNSITLNENPFGSAGAIIVDTEPGTDITGAVSASTIAWDFDYDNNVQGGRALGTNAPITIVAIADDGAQYLPVSHTITRTAGQNISINPVDELNYLNI